MAALNLLEFAAQLEREPPSAPAWVRDPAARERARRRDQERLEPIVLALALRRGPEGIIASEVIAEGITKGIFTGQETRFSPRAYSWIGPWLAALARQDKLAPSLRGGVHVRRKAERNASHSNSNLVYLHPSVLADRGSSTP